MSSGVLAVAAALAAAGAFSVATVMQFRVAGRVPDARSLRPRDLVAFIKATVSHRVWLLSVVADCVGLLLHVTALKVGAIVVVQTLLVSGVLFALVLDRLLDRRPLSRAEVTWSSVLVVGLGLFLLAIGPTPAGTSAPDSFGMVVTGVTCSVAVVTCLAVARLRPGVGAPSLGVAAGISFAITAALIKACADEITRNGFAALLSGWALWALAAVGAAGLVFNQLAFQAGPLRTSLPAITVVDPLVSVAVGIGVFDESVRSGLPAVAAQVVGLALLLSSAWFVTASSPLHPRLHDGDARPPGDAAPGEVRSDRIIT